MKFIPTLALASALVLAACANDSAQVAGDGGLPPANSAEYFRQIVGDRVFFATNRHDLSGAARATLDGQAQWMQNNPETTAVIEGHADERGTREYNLALGARRANSVMTYLVDHGVSGNRLRSVSYGKERPISTGSNANSWAQNRRGVTVIAGAPDS